MKLEKILIGAVGVCAAAMLGFAFKGKSFGNKRVMRGPAAFAAKTPPPTVDTKTIDFLKAQKLVNPEKSITSAPIKMKADAELAKLSGKFLGTLHPDKTGEDLRLMTAISAQATEKGVVGAMVGSIASKEAGRPFKFLTAIKQIKGEAGKRDSTLLQVGPGSYMQLFYLADSDRWIGNYYSKSAKGQFEYVGVAQLGRM